MPSKSWHLITYVKENTIPHVDAQSNLRFQSGNGGEHENSQDRIIQWVETDVLSRKTLSRETQQDPLLSRILEHIRKNVWSNCTIAEKPFKEARHTSTVEMGIKYSADAIVSPQILRKDVIKSVHDDIHGGVAVMQRRLRLQAWWLGYSKEFEELIKTCLKCTEIKTFKQTKIHTRTKEGVPWTRVYSSS